MRKRKTYGCAYFGVITKVPKDLEGNYACNEILINMNAKEHIAGDLFIVDPPELNPELFAEALAFEHSNDKRIIDTSKTRMLICKTPVFKLGEIMIMGSDDRTIPDGRKPIKWFVEYETFSKIEDAIKRAKEVVGDS